MEDKYKISGGAMNASSAHSLTELSAISNNHTTNLALNDNDIALTSDSQSRHIVSAESKLQVPQHLAAMEALANGYKDYMQFLKNGGKSGIEEVFGRLDLFDSRSPG